MALPVKIKLDFENGRRIINLAPAQANGEPVVFEQLRAAIEGLAWKDDVRAASTVNVSVASPGASIDGVALAASDRVLLKNQTAQTENGIYFWNGAAVPMTRTDDASTFDELEGAVVNVSEGTANQNTTWRQTQVNGVIGTNNIVWTTFGTSAPAASETVAGIIEIATQAEVDAGTDNVRAITPQKLANYSGRAKRFAATVGDGSLTSIPVVHNLNTQDAVVTVREAGGALREVICEVQYTNANTVTLLFDAAPANASLRVVVLA